MITWHFSIDYQTFIEFFFLSLFTSSHTIAHALTMWFFKKISLIKTSATQSLYLVFFTSFILFFCQNFHEKNRFAFDTSEFKCETEAFECRWKCCYDRTEWKVNFPGKWILWKCGSGTTTGWKCAYCVVGNVYDVTSFSSSMLSAVCDCLRHL